MNTQEYINELKMYLRKLDDDDREDAISYYFEYLAEAGPDGAAEAMERLGSPEKLAAGIRADQAMADFEEYDGGTGGAVGKGVQAVWHAGRASIPRTVFAAFVTVIIIIVFFAVMIALFVSSVALIAGGALGIAGGVWLLHLDWAAALFYLGIGLALIALGSLLFRFSIWASKHLLRAIAKTFNGIRHTREQRAYHRVQKQQTQHEKQYGKQQKQYEKQQKRYEKQQRKYEKQQRKREQQGQYMPTPQAEPTDMYAANGIDELPAENDIDELQTEDGIGQPPVEEGEQES